MDVLGWDPSGAAGSTILATGSGRAGWAGSTSAPAPTGDIALLRNYMASTFVTSSGGYGGTLINEAAHTAFQPTPLTNPHHA